MAGVALGDIQLPFVWQAWHLAGSGGALGRSWSPRAPRHYVALGDIDRLFAWQAWRLGTSTFVLRCRHGPWRHPPPFCVAGMALGGIDRLFAWQAWRLAASTFVLRGRRGACGAEPALVARLGALGRAGRRATLRAGMVLGDIDLLFAWQAWPLATCTFVLRGRRSTCGTGTLGWLGRPGRRATLRGRRGAW